jgi:hypothetical protein
MGVLEKEWLPFRFEDDRIVGADGTRIASRKMTKALRKLFWDDFELIEPLAWSDDTTDWAENGEDAEDETEGPSLPWVLAKRISPDEVGHVVRVTSGTVTIEDKLVRLVVNGNGIWFYFEKSPRYQPYINVFGNGDQGWEIDPQARVEIVA